MITMPFVTLFNATLHCWGDLVRMGWNWYTWNYTAYVVGITLNYTGEYQWDTSYGFLISVCSL
jgi:hypothetical protein